MYLELPILMSVFFHKDGFLERLSSSEFVALSREVEKFVTDCEVISGRRCMSLRFSLQSQVSELWVIYKN